MGNSRAHPVFRTSDAALAFTQAERLCALLEHRDYLQSRKDPVTGEYLWFDLDVASADDVTLEQHLPLGISEYVARGDVEHRFAAGLGRGTAWAYWQGRWPEDPDADGRLPRRQVPDRRVDRAAHRATLTGAGVAALPAVTVVLGPLDEADAPSWAMAAAVPMMAGLGARAGTSVGRRRGIREAAPEPGETVLGTYTVHPPRTPSTSRGTSARARSMSSA
ncbi:hypothetical protein [Streptomyces sp. TRM72054]|uniref:hypothetical protein n=1 Tax=Streptomyces sp. TRM72054 TaxID=2870562 RepID=UPI0021AB4BA7|nr:hypothetical protein [Streptomyces sp. TRM72054]